MADTVRIGIEEERRYGSIEDDLCINEGIRRQMSHI